MRVTMMAVPALKGTAELFEGDIFKPCKAIRFFFRDENSSLLYPCNKWRAIAKIKKAIVKFWNS